MRFWLDTEFLEDGKAIDLLSVGIVAEDGREYYMVNSECERWKANEWVKANVLPHIPPGSGKIRAWIADDIKEFCDPERYGKPEFWGYYADYDWVALCQLFGTMMDLPKGWPMYCNDVKQFAYMVGDPRLPEQGKGEHHALADARWNKLAYDFLVERAREALVNKAVAVKEAETPEAMVRAMVEVE